MSDIIISPSILAADFANLERDIKKVENAGADWLHIDVMDGHFVPNITIGVPVVKSIKKITNLKLDVHLMIENPAQYVEQFADVGADIITFHHEAVLNNNDRIALINKIKALGCKAGVSIKPKTNPEVILPYINHIDLVLVMTVEPGFGGQKFMPDCAEKISYFKNLNLKDLIIQVDGGINADTARICTDFGANSLVAGNYIYNASDIKTAINSLKQL